MEVMIAIAVALLLIGGGALVLAVRSRREGARDERSDAWLYVQSVAEEVGGLSVVADEDGWPRLCGLAAGVPVEIDGNNVVGTLREPRLGLRCYLPAAAEAPNAAVWLGAVPALHTEFGRPSPLGDPDGLFEVHTRAESSGSDWWSEPDLQEALLSLAGAGVLLVDGHLTVVFSELDAHSVRVALSIPETIERGVSRVTLH
ncbi:MAG: hypothetical protein KF729_24240 [Sandaracinaceae bacterium]|nr:hypothetical protein [Sandaracinaceae bacterium]